MTSQTWVDVLEEVKHRTGQARFNLWFRNIEVVSFGDTKLQMGVPTVFIQDWLRQHFTRVVEECFAEVTGHPVQVQFVVAPRLFHQLRKDELEEKAKLVKDSTELLRGMPAHNVTGQRQTALNSQMTLDNFVPGPCNNLAYAAACQVAAQESSSFNPLFIFGGTGLGKTHLLQGICQARHKGHRHLNAVYVTGESFTNQYIAGLRYKSVDAFRSHFRGADLLAIDDIHFLSNKSGIQGEFLYTLNALTASNKQIVLASNVHPSAIVNLEESLVSRFLAGMVVELKSPGLTTRRAVLACKLKERGKTCPEEVLDFLAARVEGSVREVQGIANALAAFAQLSGKQPDLGLACQALSALKGRPRTSLTMEKVVTKVTEEFGLQPEELYSPRRSKRISLPRQIAMYLGRELLGWSYAEVARHFGRKDHSSAIFACKKIAALLKSDPNLLDVVTHLKSQLRR